MLIRRFRCVQIFLKERDEVLVRDMVDFLLSFLVRNMGDFFVTGPTKELGYSVRSIVFRPSF